MTVGFERRVRRLSFFDEDYGHDLESVCRLSNRFDFFFASRDAGAKLSVWCFFLDAPKFNISVSLILSRYPVIPVSTDADSKTLPK